MADEVQRNPEERDGKTRARVRTWEELVHEATTTLTLQSAATSASLRDPVGAVRPRLGLRSRLGLWLLKPVLRREHELAARQYRDALQVYGHSERERYWMGRLTALRRIGRGDGA